MITALTNLMANKKNFFLSVSLFLSAPFFACEKGDERVMQTICEEYEQSLNNHEPDLGGDIPVRSDVNFTLYKLISSVAQEMKMICPRNISIFKGNKLTKKLSFLFGDFRLNACAGGYSRETYGISIGEELIYQLSYKQLKAIVAHELGHIKYDHANKLWDLNSRWASYFVAVLPVLKLENDLISKKLICGTALFAFVSFLLLHAKHSRNHEREADREAFIVTGNKEDLIGAIRKLEALNNCNSEKNIISRWFSSHPTCQNREDSFCSLSN